MPELMDDLMDAMISRQAKDKHYFSAAVVRWVFSKISDNSKLRLWCVAEAASRMKSRPGDEKRMEEYATLFDEHPEFILRLFRFQTKYHTLLDAPNLISPKRFKKLDPCVFHCHGADKPCSLKST
jgi:hypothetical protein